MAKKIVLLADIIVSKKTLKTPHDIEHIVNSLKKINKQFNQRLTIPFEVVAGDGFGAVIKDLATAIEIVLEIQQQLQPLQVRVAVVQDEVICKINQKKFNEINGKALWEASELITTMRKERSLFSLSLSDNYLQVSVNCIANLILQQRAQWTENIWCIYSYDNQQKTQKDIAKKLSVSQQYISQALKQHKIRFIRKMQNDIIDAIKNLGK